MCGIFGIITRKGPRQAELRRFVNGLAVSTQVRGKDASGFAAKAGEEIYTDKAPECMQDFVRKSLEWRWITYQPEFSLIGHTRMATSGSPKDNKNNHPFHSARYSLVHNGIISRHRQIAEANNLNLKTDCDSEVLIHLFNKENPVDGAREIFKKVGSLGSFAVAVLDKHDGSLFLMRSMSMPLYYGYVKRWDSFVFASTNDIVKEAATIATWYSKGTDFIEEIDKGLTSLDDGVIVKVDRNFEVSTYPGKAAGSIDLYEHQRRWRQWLWFLVGEDVIDEGIIKHLQKKPRPCFVRKDTRLLISLGIGKYDSMSNKDKLLLWKNMTKERITMMSDVEYVAYREFCNV